MRKRMVLATLPYVYPRADRIVALSGGVAREVESLSRRLRGRVSIIPNAGMDGSVRALAQETPADLPAADGPVVVASGRLTEQKGYPYLLEAMRRVREEIPASLWLLGEGHLRAPLQAQAEELGIAGAVRFLGFRDNPHAVVRAADVFALSSLFEGFGNVIVEAMAVGTPVVSTDCPYGPGEIIRDGVDGLLVPPADPAALAAALLRVLRDPELAGRLREAGLRRAEDFSAHAAAERYGALFEEVAAERRAGQPARGKKALRVMYVVATPQNHSGSQRAIGLLAEHAPPEVEPCVVCTGEGRAVDAYRAQGVPVHVMPVPRALKLYDRALLQRGRARQALVFARDVVPYSLALRRFIREWGADVVHCESARAVLLAGPAARLAGRPVLWHLQGENVLTAHSHLNRAASLLTTRVVRCAESIGKSLSPRLRPRTILYGVAQGTATPGVRERCDAMLRERGLDPERCMRVLTTASLVPFKGLHHLADALGALLRDRPEGGEQVAWFLLGDARTQRTAKYRELLERRIEANGLAGNVFWAGWQDNAFGWMAASDVIVIPTVLRESFTYPGEPPIDVVCSEGLPLAMLEAMQAGRPVVATDVAGVGEALENGKTGLLVRPGSPDALRDALGQLLDHPERRREMGEAGRARSVRFTADRMAAEFHDLYREMVSGEDGGERARQPA
jgi:glycosyltransferase involved in cell wall biosynthesis